MSDVAPIDRRLATLHEAEWRAEIAALRERLARVSETAKTRRRKDAALGQVSRRSATGRPGSFRTLPSEVSRPAKAAPSVV